MIAQNRPEGVEIRVVDSGIGIPKERMKDLFEPFTQVDGSSTRLHDGTGLGLNLGRSFARMLGGDLTVESELGKGSTFRLRLPKQTNAAGIPTRRTAWYGARHRNGPHGTI